jgi:hypothetical protein
MVWLKWLSLLLLLVLVAFAGLSLYGTWRWNGLTQALLARLEAARQAPQVAQFDPRELDGLPPVVQRYFRAALPESARIVTAVTLTHSGTFNMSLDAPKWLPFTSHQRVATRRPGFVWDGRVAMFPGVAVRVHDAYVAGEGILQPSVLGVFDLANLRGTPEMAVGELMRFFAEAAWYPTALLPSQGVQWQGIDERSARATLADGPITLTLTFGFGADGLIETVRADARGLTRGDQIVMRAWEGRFTNYQTQAGMRVPMSGEVAWLLPAEEGGRKPYWRGTVTSISYEFSP